MKKAIVALLLLSASAVPAVAQQSLPVEKRVDKLEKEMKAVQRKVFPGGAQQFFEPEIKPQVAPAVPAGTPVDTPVTDLTRRVDALGSFLDTEDGQNLLAGTKRAANILVAEEKKGTTIADGVVESLLEDEEELTRIQQ